jgi:hypothetical protein
MPLRAIFADQKAGMSVGAQLGEAPAWRRLITDLAGVRVAIAAGILVKGAVGGVDLLIAGDVTTRQIAQAVTTIESDIGRELSYTVLPYEEFYYRLSVHDRFITGIIQNKHQILVDTDGALTK